LRKGDTWEIDATDAKNQNMNSIVTKGGFLEYNLHQVLDIHVSLHGNLEGSKDDERFFFQIFLFLFSFSVLFNQ